MKYFVLAVLSLCLSASMVSAADPDFTYFTNLALAVQAEKDTYYNDLATHQPAATLAADRASFDARCQELRDAMEPFKDINEDPFGPDFNYLRNVAFMLQAEKDFLYWDIDTVQSPEEISMAQSDLDYWVQNMLEDLECFLP